MTLPKPPVTGETDGGLRDFILRMPKVEIHLHLEGAIPIDALFDLVRRGKDPHVLTPDDLKAKLDYVDFEHFIDTWVWKNTFIRHESDFEAITYAVLRDLARENVRYVEAFYSPGDYRRQGLTVGGITEHIIKGRERARRDFGIRCNLIVDLIRDHGPEIGMRRLKECLPYLGKGLVGIGLGGSEQLFPAAPYGPVYAAAREMGYRLTAHAGEVAGADSIRDAVEILGVERVGHGLRAGEDPDLVELLGESKTPLEMCIMSNLRTGVCPSIAEHPIRRYFDRGLVVTVNSDDPTMFNSTLTDEYLALAGDLGFTLPEIKVVAMNAITASFLPASEKSALRAQFEAEWASSN
jgi:adenosine deaminase